MIHRDSVFRGFLLPALAAIGLPLVAAIALPTALSSRSTRGIVIRATPPRGARNVSLAGTMNEWTEERMTDRDGDGVYELAFSLAPGTYQYRLLADGRSFSDASAGSDGISVLVVPGPGAANDQAPSGIGPATHPGESESRTASPGSDS